MFNGRTVSFYCTVGTVQNIKIFQRFILLIKKKDRICRIKILNTTKIEYTDLVKYELKEKYVSQSSKNVNFEIWKTESGSAWQWRGTHNPTAEKTQKKKKNVQLRCVSHAFLLDINPALRGIEPEEPRGGAAPPVAHHEGNCRVERHRVPQLVFEHVQVVEAVGVRAACVFEAEGVGVLGYAVHMLHTWQMEFLHENTLLFVDLRIRIRPTLIRIRSGQYGIRIKKLWNWQKWADSKTNSHPWLS